MLKQRVVFVGDLSRGGQADNTLNIFRLFSPIFKDLNAPTFYHVSDINRQMDQSIWVDRWRSYLESERVSGLGNINLDAAAVVGFELSDEDLNYLDAQSIPWVNLAIHPLRFLDDLYFEVTSSIHYDWAPLCASAGLIELRVNLLRNRYYKIERSENIKTLAIFGQAPFDKSIYFEGMFHSLDSYFDRIDRLVADHGRVIYKPHPYLSDQTIDRKICDRYSAQLSAERNVYKLLASGEITTACAISSSVVTEAPYFDVQSVFLDPRAKVFGLPISYKKLLGELQFWGGRFLGLDGIPIHSNIADGVPEDYLRKIFGCWGYVTTSQEVEERFEKTMQDVRAVVMLSTVAEQADARAAEQEHRASTAEALAAKQEQRAVDAEALAVKQEQRAVDAEALAVKQEQRAVDAEALAHQQHKCINELRGNLHEWWLQACAFDTEKNALLQSWSWRVMAPLRGLGSAAIDGRMGVRRAANHAAYVTINALQRPLATMMRVILKNPTLTDRINQRLMRYPSLYLQLLNVARRNEIISDTQPYAALAVSAELRDNPNSSNLTPRGQEIYNDLKIVIKRRQKKNG